MTARDMEGLCPNHKSRTVSETKDLSSSTLLVNELYYLINSKEVGYVKDSKEVGSQNPFRQSKTKFLIPKYRVGVKFRVWITEKILLH